MGEVGGRGTREHDAHDLAGAMRASLHGVEGSEDVFEPALRRMVEAALDWHADVFTAHAAAPDGLRERIEALTDLSEAATPGKWGVVGPERNLLNPNPTSSMAHVGCQSADDAALIAAAVNLIRNVLAERPADGSGS